MLSFPTLSRSLAIVAALTLAATASAEGPQEVIDNAVEAVQDMGGDPGMGWFREHVQNAQGVVVIPSLVTAGFVFGGTGGNGVVMTRGGKSWSHPSFVSMGSVTFGLQAGAQAGQTILLIMTKKGVDAFLSTKFKLGTGASIAVGPVGQGAKVATADILSFSRAAGAFGGVTVEGATIGVRDGWNQEFYDNKEVRPVDILVTRNQSNPGATKLREAMAKVGGR